MNIIKILDEINNKDAISLQDGTKVFEKVKSFIEQKQEIVIDFEGIDLVLSTFLNPAIGQLYYLYDKELVDKLLQFNNLMEVDNQTLEKVIQNAINQKENKPSINEGLLDG